MIETELGLGSGIQEPLRLACLCFVANPSLFAYDHFVVMLWDIDDGELRKVVFFQGGMDALLQFGIIRYDRADIYHEQQKVRISAMLDIDMTRPSPRSTRRWQLVLSNAPQAASNNDSPLRTSFISPGGLWRRKLDAIDMGSLEERYDCAVVAISSP